MAKNRSRRTKRPAKRSHGISSLQRRFRRAVLEQLEDRRVLSAPMLTITPAPTNLVVQSGAPLLLALDGSDDPADTLTYTVTSNNSNLKTTVPDDSRSLRISVKDYGDMVFELFEDLAPNTTARIIALAQQKKYDNTSFYRVIKSFMIQGGDPNGSGLSAGLDDEFNANLQFTGAGTLAMAKSLDDTNDMQLFITGAATRWLDFNHTIFGFLTEGDSVRRSIEAVDTVLQDPSDSTSEKSAPATPLVISSVTVEPNNQNRVLMLSAPEGYTGFAHVTVNVSDGHGGTAQQEFDVTILADDSNANPYLLPINPISMAVGQTAQFQVKGLDVEGNAVYFGGWNRFDWGLGSSTPEQFINADVHVTVDPATGAGTVSVANSQPGVYGILVGVNPYGTDVYDYRAQDPRQFSSNYSSYWDFQFVSVFVHPAAPGGVELLGSSDTGVSQSDHVTSLNNSAGKTLKFRVSGVLDGTDVMVLADGVEIGRATASGGEAMVASDGLIPLADGTHQITARQILRDQQVNVGNRRDKVNLGSDDSPAISVTTDTVPPQFTSSPMQRAVRELPYAYDVQSDAEGATGASYRLDSSPSGMLIDHQTGRITWTPQAKHGDSQSVKVIVSDAAGNETQQAFDIAIRQFNERPQFAPMDKEQSLEVGQLFTAKATDPDAQAGELQFSYAGNLPQGASFNSSTGEFTWRPTAAQAGRTYPLTLKVNDAWGATDQLEVVLAVAASTNPGGDPSASDGTAAALRNPDLITAVPLSQGQPLAPAATVSDALLGTAGLPFGQPGAGVLHLARPLGPGRTVLFDAGLFGAQLDVYSGTGGIVHQPLPKPAKKPASDTPDKPADPSKARVPKDESTQPGDDESSSHQAPETIDAALDELFTS